MSDFKDRIIRASKLDPHLYEEVEADRSAITQALMVVLLSSIAGGIGTGGAVLTEDGAGKFISALIAGSLASLVSWMIWSYLTYLIGTKIFRGPETSATYGELLRTIGFSASPGIIRVIGLIPMLQGLVFLIAGVWSLAAMIIAVRQALDFTTGRAIGTCLVGWVIQAIILAFILLLVR